RGDAPDSPEAHRSFGLARRAADPLTRLSIGAKSPAALCAEVRPSASPRGAQKAWPSSSKKGARAPLGRLLLVFLIIPVNPNVVVVEVAGQLGGALVLEHALEAAPRRLARALATALRQVQVLVDLIQVDVRFLDFGLIGLVVFEF